MQFINETGNTVKLGDITRIIPFIGKQPQEITADEVKRSKTFQIMCLSKKFLIVSATDDRMEQNLLRMQEGRVPVEGEKIDVMVRGHFYSNVGYGKANRNLVFAMGRNGIRVGIETPQDSEGSLNQMELEKIARFRRELPNAICIDSMIPTFAAKGDYRYNILNTTVEATTVPPQFVDICDEYDEVWVASDFCKEVFESHGVSKPIFVIPNAVETKVYNENAVPHTFNPPLKKFVFVSVMSWSYRKGYDALLKAYISEFSDQDDVSLLIVTKYDGENDDADKYIKMMTECDGAPHVARCGREVPEFEMPRLYKACNCFVLPSRGEGFGLPYVEASLCGLPVIATNHSAHTMFLNESNSYLIYPGELVEMELGKTNVHYWDGQLFPSVDGERVIGELRAAMRSVYKNYDEAKEKNKKLQAELAKYSLESVGKVAAERLRTIWKQIQS